MKSRFIIGLGCLLLAAVSTRAQQDLDTARNQTIHGESTEEVAMMKMRLTPLDANPPTPIEYTVTGIPSTNGSTFSQPIKLFPGRNSIEVLNGAANQKIQMTLNVKAPRLRVQLTWAGGKQDYDLYVNDIYYGNNPHDPDGAGELDRDVTNSSVPATKNITFGSAQGGLYRIYVNYYADNDRDEEGHPMGSPKPTTVKVFIDEQQVHSATRTISEHQTYLGAMANRHGASVRSCSTPAAPAAALPSPQPARGIFCRKKLS